MPNEAALLDKNASGASGVTTAPKPTGAPAAKEDVLFRMRTELARALKKNPRERRWVMVIDQRRCIGCHACTVACMAENKLPPGVVYRPVVIKEVGMYPKVTMTFLPRPCMQCENPPCTEVCPVHATYTNKEGIVVMDYDQCIGCRACIAACPYGARTFDYGHAHTDNTPEVGGMILGRNTADNYERDANVEYGKKRERKGHSSPVGNVRKCHFCLHRLMAGILPACTTTCIGRATYFGDAADPDSLVSELINHPNIVRLKEELGTAPRVYYIA